MTKTWEKNGQNGQVVAKGELGKMLGERLNASSCSKSVKMIVRIAKLQGKWRSKWPKQGKRYNRSKKGRGMSKCDVMQEVSQNLHKWRTREKRLEDA
jgi:hypothetical protein